MTSRRVVPSCSNLRVLEAHQSYVFLTDRMPIAMPCAGQPPADAAASPAAGSGDSSARRLSMNTPSPESHSESTASRSFMGSAPSTISQLLHQESVHEADFDSAAPKHMGDQGGRDVCQSDRGMAVGEHPTGVQMYEHTTPPCMGGQGLGVQSPTVETLDHETPRYIHSDDGERYARQQDDRSPEDDSGGAHSQFGSGSGSFQGIAGDAETGNADRHDRAAGHGVGASSSSHGRRPTSSSSGAESARFLSVAVAGVEQPSRSSGHRQRQQDAQQGTAPVEHREWGGSGASGTSSTDKRQASPSLAHQSSFRGGPSSASKLPSSSDGAQSHKLAATETSPGKHLKRLTPPLPTPQDLNEHEQQQRSHYQQLHVQKQQHQQHQQQQRQQIKRQHQQQHEQRQPNPRAQQAPQATNLHHQRQLPKSQAPAISLAIHHDGLQQPAAPRARSLDPVLRQMDHSKKPRPEVRW